ncbi:MAG: 2-polyprenyl-3-methyl-6-methoxy-1,4-benzoquinone monooxygenase [Pigmentiphaga sp.]|uniref:2-polyprenyl-3-methyl-6-methoxy-1,4-benzoquinone monooxygenase n=1 Tax=Pigmentiphaga sp. TaxID=1977564 RepID=UPI0029B97B9E|nr:2-polyprenyl-3-methyl-6-methoxy-1,4-benzoquinone monooxygenase [Pigmentiphaga sp.]MDX3904856.1 2-polyprenyl-3-methyl-6-methoxy-1,4-benzoquinone monooxygenase [Pigmentiphaga sp.]
MLDRVLAEADRAVRVLTGSVSARRPNPAGRVAPGSAAGEDGEAPLSEAERRHAAGLMRVNHVGEICAQALYRGQALVCEKPATRRLFLDAAAEETDHLAWLDERLRELRSRPSFLNPFWYAGAFGLGVLAGRVGDAWNLGFMAETERQVERHLDGHLGSLPANDTRSRAIVEQMSVDERQHRVTAEQYGGVSLPAPARAAMRCGSRVMTSTAYYI